MSYSNLTEYLKLPQWVKDDKPNWLNDLNEAFEKIDLYAQNAKSSSSWMYNDGTVIDKTTGVITKPDGSTVEPTGKNDGNWVYADGSTVNTSTGVITSGGSTLPPVSDDLSAIQKEIDDINGKIAILNNDGMQFGQDINDLDSRVTTNSNNISDIMSDISDIMSDSSFEKKVNVINTILNGSFMGSNATGYGKMVKSKPATTNNSSVVFIFAGTDYLIQGLQNAANVIMVFGSKIMILDMTVGSNDITATTYSLSTYANGVITVTKNVVTKNYVNGMSITEFDVTFPLTICLYRSNNTGKSFIGTSYMANIHDEDGNVIPDMSESMAFANISLSVVDFYTCNKNTTSELKAVLDSMIS